MSTEYPIFSGDYREGKELLAGADGIDDDPCLLSLAGVQIGLVVGATNRIVTFRAGDLGTLKNNGGDDGGGFTGTGADLTSSGLKNDQGGGKTE